MILDEVAAPKTEQTLLSLNRLPAFNETAARLLARPFGEEDSLGVVEATFRSDPGLAGSS